MTEFYAQPYSIEHTGFTFNSFETFEAGMEKLNKRGCEEVEIQFIDGEMTISPGWQTPLPFIRAISPSCSMYLTILI